MIGINENKVFDNDVRKNKYETPIIEVVIFISEDIITISDAGLNQNEFGYGDDLEW